MDNKENDQNINSLKNPVKPRCINIDCAFNSSLDPTDKRNVCNHPNVYVEKAAFEITVAICSEFRSKKDYKFTKPNLVTDLKNDTVSELNIYKVEDAAALNAEGDQIKLIENREIEYNQKLQDTIAEAEERHELPYIIESGEADYLEPKLTTSSNFYLQVLKRFYQPNMKRGMIISVILHFVVIGLMYLFFTTDETSNGVLPEQRIVIVEDIDPPKFEPPDMDAEEPPPSGSDLTENQSEVRPQITPKNIRPRINRPDNNTGETNDTSTASRDTTGRSGLNDSLLALYMNDTSRFTIPDSLRSAFAENEIGMSLWYPKDWKLRDSRTIDPNQPNFTGVIINTDSLSPDPGAVTIFVLIENDEINSFNKTVFKHEFMMDDTTSSAFSTDPIQLGQKRISYKFYIFSPTARIFVNTETKNEFFEKYKPYIEAIVRTIKIIKPNTGG